MQLQQEEAPWAINDSHLLAPVALQPKGLQGEVLSFAPEIKKASHVHPTFRQFPRLGSRQLKPIGPAHSACIHKGTFEIVGFAQSIQQRALAIRSIGLCVKKPMGVVTELQFKLPVYGAAGV